MKKRKTIIIAAVIHFRISDRKCLLYELHRKEKQD